MSGDTLQVTESLDHVTCKYQLTQHQAQSQQFARL